MSLAMTVTRDPGLRAFIHDQHATYFSDFASMQTMIESFRASVTHTVTEVAGSLTMPTLLIGAEKDQISSASAVRALATLVPDATLVMIPDVGHLIHYEKPREAATAIVEWLGQGELA
jgi:pimeloyl-ACP methyl ester carboxylesterase